MEPNNNQVNNPATEDVTKYIEQNIARMINTPGLRIAVPKPALLGIIKAALKGITVIPATAEKKEIALHTLAQQVMALSQLVEHGMTNSLTTAPPAGISEAMQAFPKGVIPKTAYMNQMSPNSVPTEQAGDGQAAPVSQMPGEGVGEETQKSENQPPQDLEPISDTPGTPDIETGPESAPSPEHATAPNGAASRAKSAPQSAEPGTAQPGFDYAASPEQRQAGMENYTQQEQAQQLAQSTTPQAASNDGTPASAQPADASTAGTTPSPTTGAAQTADSTGTSAPQQAPTNADNTGTTAEAQSPANANNPDNEEMQNAWRGRQLANQLFRRTKIKKVDKDIKDNAKKLNEVKFQYATEYIFLVCLKEGLDFLDGLLSLTGAWAIFAAMINAALLSAQWFILWLQTKQWREEVFNNKQALQTIVVYIVELIPIVNILPLNILNAYALQVESERQQKKYRTISEKLAKQRHKLVNARKI